MIFVHGALDTPATTVPVLYMAPQFGGGSGGVTPPPTTSVHGRGFLHNVGRLLRCFVMFLALIA